ncbi:MAG: phosphoserine phosphatase [Caulobacteraceae bacterium]|nr:phosphoserine phosphatase [Caulobacteraceae bacterium]
MRMICDFDGTITQQDTTDRVLEALARPAWRDLEDRWISGAITAAACMRGQIALIDASQDELDAVLDGAALDPGFLDFVAWCDGHGLPVSIVSDGVDYFIARILARYGLERLPVIANRLTGGPGVWRLEQPWSRAGCAGGSGVCKCAAAAPWEPERGTTIFAGDGRSDFCVSGRPDVVFAKGSLARYAADRGQAFLPFETFHDITRSLATLLGDRAAGLGRAAS